jgi:hypothetical protein
MLQVFHLSQTYDVSVLFGCCKSKSSVAHAAMHMRSGGDACGLPTWALRGRAKRRRGRGMLARARAWNAGARRGNGCSTARPSER